MEILILLILSFVIIILPSFLEARGWRVEVPNLEGHLNVCPCKLKIPKIA